MRTAVIFLLAALVLVAPALAACPAGCNCASGAPDTCASCMAGYKFTAAVGATAASCAICDYRKGSADMNTAATCAVDCHESCAQCSAAGADKCMICRDGYRLTTVTGGMGTCVWCPLGKGRARLMAYPMTIANEDEAICTLTCSMTGGCGRCATAEANGCVNCMAGWRWDGSGKCAWCMMGMGKDGDTMSMWGSTTAKTNAEACTTMCTGTSCGTCSMAAPGVCLACATGMTLKDGKCMSSGSNANILSTLCAAIAAAYVMF